MEGHIVTTSAVASHRVSTPKHEATLVERAKAGQPAAFAEIYDRYQPLVYRYVFYRVGSPATAEDLTSQVFVRVVERMDGYEYRGRPLLAWLYTIARNVVVDHHRRVGKRLLLPLDRQMWADTPDPEVAGERAVMRRRLAAAISCLTEAQRRVILIKFVEGLDNATAAATLGKSVGAVKALQHRALAALHRLLAPESPGS